MHRPNDNLVSCNNVTWSLSGVLASLDGYMNIALEQTEEYVNGQLKNKFEDAFIRGNNGTGQCNSVNSIHQLWFTLIVFF